MMIADVWGRLLAVPLVPFIIRTSDRRQDPAPARDPAFVTPRGNRIVVVDDEGTTAVLGPIHLNNIVDQQINGE